MIEAAKDFGQLADLTALGSRGGLHLDEHQVAFDVVLRADVDHFDDGHDLFELLAHLLENVVVSHHHEGHPRQAGIFGLADRQAVDVIAARGEHSRNMGQHARNVLDDSRQQVTHRVLPR